MRNRFWDYEKSTRNRFSPQVGLGIAKRCALTRGVLLQMMALGGKKVLERDYWLVQFEKKCAGGRHSVPLPPDLSMKLLA